MVRILFLGDVVGKPGRRVLRDHLPGLRSSLAPDFIIANGENSAGGVGIEPSTADEIFAAGVDFITTGNHIWNKRDIIPYLEQHRGRIIRPLNYADGAPGAGHAIWTTKDGVRIGVLNIIGRVFMPDLVDCPFRGAERGLAALAGCDVIFVDFHAEATSEKIAMGYHLDGRATMLVGTHTHVQTADERIFPKGLGYITDAGMCGPRDSVIGVSHELVVEKFLSGRPTRFDVASGEPMINGIVVDCDPAAHRAVSVARVMEVW